MKSNIIKLTYQFQVNHMTDNQSNQWNGMEWNINDIGMIKKFWQSIKTCDKIKLKMERLYCQFETLTKKNLDVNILQLQLQIVNGEYSSWVNNTKVRNGTTDGLMQVLWWCKTL